MLILFFTCIFPSASSHIVLLCSQSLECVFTWLLCWLEMRGRKRLQKNRMENKQERLRDPGGEMDMCRTERRWSTPIRSITRTVSLLQKHTQTHIPHVKAHTDALLVRRRERVFAWMTQLGLCQFWKSLEPKCRPEHTHTNTHTHTHTHHLVPCLLITETRHKM